MILLDIGLGLVVVSVLTVVANFLTGGTHEDIRPKRFRKPL